VEVADRDPRQTQRQRECFFKPTQNPPKS
jgi:hypothetical protein